jgi:hypothetical protein
MKWSLNFSVGSKSFNMQAEVICTTHQIEQVRITGNNIVLVIQNNRPLLDAIELRKPLTWKVIQGEVKDNAVYNAIREKVEHHLVKSGPASYPQRIKLSA